MIITFSTGSCVFRPKKLPKIPLVVQINKWTSDPYGAVSQFSCSGFFFLASTLGSASIVEIVKRIKGLKIAFATRVIAGKWKGATRHRRAGVGFYRPWSWRTARSTTDLPLSESIPTENVERKHSERLKHRACRITSAIRHQAYCVITTCGGLIIWISKQISSLKHALCTGKMYSLQVGYTIIRNGPRVIQ